MAIEIIEQFRIFRNEPLLTRDSVATIADRNNIPVEERFNGIKTIVRSEGKRYEILYSGNFNSLSTAAKNAFLADNNNWKEVVGNAALDLKEDKANKGVANGYTPLGADTKIPLQFIPDSVLGALEYKGVWSATTNTAPHGSPENGWYYKVNVAGQTTFTGSTVDWAIGDWIIYNGTTWDRVANADKVISVNGQEGEVIIDDSTLEHEPAVSIPTWISSVYTAGKAAFKGVFDAIITRIGVMDTQLTNIEDKLDTIEEGANNYTPPDYFGDVEILETGETIINNGVVKNSHLGSMPANTFKGAISAGYPVNISSSQVKTMLSLPENTEGDLTAAQAAIDSLIQLVASDNFNLDTIQEIVDFIEENRTDLDTYISALENKVDKEAGKSLILLTDIAKLSGIEEGATADQTAAEIRDLLITLVGTNRLPASAIKDLPETTVVDNLTTQSATSALSANQGYVLNQTKLSVSGDNYIATRPVGNATTNGTNLKAIYAQAKLLTPAGQPLSATNRATILLFPGTYNVGSNPLEMDTNFIDLFGIGAKESIKLTGSGETIEQTCTDIRLQNFTSLKPINIYQSLPNAIPSVYRDLDVDCFYGNCAGTFENITGLPGQPFIFEVAMDEATYKRIYSNKGLFESLASSFFTGRIEDSVCTNIQYMTIAGTITRCYLEGESDFDPIVDLKAGGEITYSTIINTGTPAGSGVYDSAYSIYSNGTDLVTVHHCHSNRVGGSFNNTVENGFNTWDEGGGEISLTKATQAQAEEGLDDYAYMTSLKSVQALAQRVGAGLGWNNDTKEIELGGNSSDDITIHMTNGTKKLEITDAYAGIFRFQGSEVYAEQDYITFKLLQSFNVETDQGVIHLKAGPTNNPSAIWLDAGEIELTTHYLTGGRGMYYSGLPSDPVDYTVIWKGYVDTTQIGTAITASRSLVLADAGGHKITPVNSASNIVLTIDNDTTLDMPIGSTINLRRRGAGSVEIVGAAGVTVEGIQDTNGDYKIVRYGIVSAYKEAANLWVVYGALES